MNDDFEHPPLQNIMPPGVEAQALGVLVILMVLLLAILLLRARPRERMIVLLCVVGGALAVTFDAQFSVLMLRWFPKIGSDVLYVSSGRAVPLFWALFQAFFVGGAIAWLITGRQRDPATVWNAVWLLAAIRLAAELVGVRYGLWSYYGWQPFRVGGVPLWMPIFSATAVVVAARFVEFSLTTHHRATLLIGVPLSYSIAVAMQAWPIGLALNHRDSNVVWASVTMVCAILLSGILLEALRRLPTFRAPA